jgi:hypothetical protein
MFHIVACRDPLLGNDYETTFAARQQILNKQQLNYKDEERCFLCGPGRNVIRGTDRESEGQSVCEEKTRMFV